MRIAVSGGGTVGHISPVLATVDALQKRSKPPQIIFIGQTSRVEADLVRAQGWRFVGVAGGKFRRLPGAGFWRNALRVGDQLRNLRDLFLIALGTLQALWVLGRFHPEAVFNKAGPTGLPVGLACWLLRIPMIIHEPDITPGLNNRILSRWAAGVAVGFPKSLYAALPATKLTYTGNPVQTAITTGQAARAAHQFKLDAARPLVVVVGGSQGAVAVNTALLAILPDVLPLAQIVHQSGEQDFERVTLAAGELGLGAAQGYHAVPFLPIEQLGDAYKAATLVVARGGANTIAELAALAKPAIILPNHGAAAHQVANARQLAEANAAVVLSDEDPRALLQATKALIAAPARQHELAAQLAHFNVPDAPDRLADLVLSVAKPPRGSHREPAR